MREGGVEIGLDWRVGMKRRKEGCWRILNLVDRYRFCLGGGPRSISQWHI